MVVVVVVVVAAAPAVVAVILLWLLPVLLLLLRHLNAVIVSRVAMVVVALATVASICPGIRRSRSSSQ